MGYIKRRLAPKGYKPPQARIKAHAKIRLLGQSEVAETKRNIQDLLRQIVIIRDGGCILREVPSHFCNGFAPSDGHLVLQADHLITRSNAATYADSRLVVCVCKGAHGWKSLGGNKNKAQYDELVKTLLSPERVALWEACERDSWRPQRTGIYDWKLAEAALKVELRALQQPNE